MQKLEANSNHTNAILPSEYKALKANQQNKVNGKCDYVVDQR
jgi:hypothetical protein